MKKIWGKIKAFFTNKDYQLLMLLGFGLAALIYILIEPVETVPWWAAMLIGSFLSSGVIVAIAFGKKQNRKDKKLHAGDIVSGELGVLGLILASLINIG